MIATYVTKNIQTAKAKMTNEQFPIFEPMINDVFPYRISFNYLDE